MLGDRAPTISFESEQTTEAGYGFWTKLLAGTQMDCSFTLGSTQYNKAVITIPAFQFERIEESEREGIAMYRASGLLVSPGGLDDEISIVFN